MNTKVIIAAGDFLLCTACTEQLPLTSGQNEVEEAELTAWLEESAESRTTYASSDGTFSWSDGDEIAVLFTKTGSSNLMSKASYVNTTSGIGAFRVSFKSGYAHTGYAIYPYSVVNGISNLSTPSITLPVSYSSGAATGLEAKLPLLAYNETASTLLNFKHVCSLLRLSCTNVTPTASTLSVTVTGKNVTGGFLVSNPTASNPAIHTSDGTNSMVSVATTPASSQMLNIPLPCGSYNTTITVSDGTKSTTFSFVKTMSRGQGCLIDVDLDS